MDGATDHNDEHPVFQQLPHNPGLVVSDATPLRYLVQIGEVELLRELYGRVIIPLAVFNELSASKTPQIVSKWMATLPDWVEVERVPDLLDLPFGELGMGEREAIFFAKNSTSSVLLTDDQGARTAAESLGIRVVPTIRILSTASLLSLVDFDDAILRLQETNFRVSAKVIDQIRRGLPAKTA